MGESLPSVQQGPKTTLKTLKTPIELFFSLAFLLVSIHVTPEWKTLPLQITLEAFNDLCNNRIPLSMDFCFHGREEYCILSHPMGTMKENQFISLLYCKENVSPNNETIGYTENSNNFHVTESSRQANTPYKTWNEVPHVRIQLFDSRVHWNYF